MTIKIHPNLKKNDSYKIWKSIALQYSAVACAVGGDHANGVRRVELALSGSPTHSSYKIIKRIWGGVGQYSRPHMAETSALVTKALV